MALRCGFIPFMENADLFAVYQRLAESLRSDPSYQAYVAQSTLQKYSGLFNLAATDEYFVPVNCS